ncbi:hypothetical protein DSECCO2_615210 [anaerobic digester metagenome]
MHPANYNKVEKGEREPSIDALDKIAKFFGLTVDQLIHYEGNIPKEITIEDKTTSEKLRMIVTLRPWASCVFQNSFSILRNKPLEL